ncbi:MAG: UDP-3-O-(3-hydroxymyristoyl)glucosamine N-acyltransferase [Puniceicoccales bacterium]|jgi:UDP-3-O-[3-hydroxymyristoyl] glucosamine N-acyltransferase|nr:UDP-3-O-(3-hydroxymyristoyl)glucosamine N-acyltransferase [Puniceicoccales bacterium]
MHHISLTIDELAALTAPVERAENADAPLPAAITGIAALDEARPSDLSFLGNIKYAPQVAATAAGVVLLPLGHPAKPRPGQIFLFVKDPSSALARVCDSIEQKLWPRPAPGIHPTAIIAGTATLGANVHIGPYVVIEDGATVGDNSVLEAHAYVGRSAVVGPDNWFKPRAALAEFCVTGARVKLFIGAVVGGDGFGFEPVKDPATGEVSHRKIPQIGNVVLEDDVEVGANATIDRARFATTRVGRGTKIDNLVQVGHNCRIGRHCFLVSQSGMAGSTILEDYVALAGQAGLAGHLRIGAGAQIGAQCGVMSDIPAGSRMLGSPAMPVKEALRVMAIQKQLPELIRRMKTLEERAAFIAEALAAAGYAPTTAGSAGSAGATAQPA